MPTTPDLIGTIARPAVRLGVSASQLPVDLVGRLMGEQDNEHWPPALVVEGLQASALLSAGSFLHDDQLRAQGQLLAEKVQRLRTAEVLEAEAEAKHQQADAERDARNEAAARQREQASETAKERRATAARRAEAKKREAQQKAARAAKAADEAREDAEQRVEAQQRQARADVIAIERKAVAKEKAAAAAARKAAVTDAQIKATNQARKS